MFRNLRIMGQFFYRDLYIYRKQWFADMVNYVILYPLLYMFCIGYLQARIYFPLDGQRFGTLLFAGNVLLTVILLTFKKSTALIFDLEQDRYIDYQLLILSPSWVLLHRILSGAFFTFIVVVPFFPAAFLTAPSFLFITDKVQWIPLFIMLALGCLCASAYGHLASIALPNSRYLSTLWARVNNPLLNLGGFLVPFAVMWGFSYTLGLLVLCNPLLYISEGVRRAVLQESMFLGIGICSLALIGFTAGFYLIALWFFKRKVDHI